VTKKYFSSFLSHFFISWINGIEVIKKDIVVFDK